MEIAWVAPFASTVRHAASWVASGRIPMQALVAALAADEKRSVTCLSLLATAARRGVIGPTAVAPTAAIVGTAAVMSHGVARRTDRREDPGATDAKSCRPCECNE